MNLKSNLLVAAALLTGGFGFTSTALAGEGGVAGSAAFQLSNNGNVQRASVAVAVGKSTAYAGASTVDATQTAAFATGSGGAFSITGSAPFSFTEIGEESVTGLGTEQANTININSIITGVTAIPQ